MDPHATNKPNVVHFPAPRRRLRADVPPFDPTNPAHIQGWESMWDLGQLELRLQRGELP